MKSKIIKIIKPIVVLFSLALIIVGLYFYHQQYLCFEYTPLQIKQALTGYGRAEKKQVMEMTRQLLKLREVPKPDDTADALAVAICHAHSFNSQSYNLLNNLKK